MYISYEILVGFFTNKEMICPISHFFEFLANFIKFHKFQNLKPHIFFCKFMNLKKYLYFPYSYLNRSFTSCFPYVSHAEKYISNTDVEGCLPILLQSSPSARTANLSVEQINPLRSVLKRTII